MRSLLPTGAALAAALALAACGGGSAGSSTDAAQTTGTPGAATSAATSSAAPTGAQSTGSSTASSGAAAAPQCRAAGLALSFLGGQGATGHGELGFTLRNTGSACSTGGYPGIQFLDRAGNPLPTTPSHTTSDFFGQLPLRPLTVAAGQTVSFRLGVSHGEESGAGCSTAYGLQVIPPNDTATLRVSIPQGATECGTTTVSPMQPGSSAYR